MARVELIDAAVDDLEKHRHHGKFALLLAKLLLIEANPLQVGQPLHGDLVTYRKLVFGRNTWRIIFRPTPDGAIVLIVVIGDRADSACYDEAKARLAKLPPSPRVRKLQEIVADHESTKRRLPPSS